MYMCLVYITPETSTHQSSRNSVWNILEEEIAIFSTTGHILLTGDFSVRTGSLPNYVNHDSTPHIPLPPDYMVDTPLPRNSEDSVVNNYGRELLALCIASRLRIINGCTRPDNIKGAFTYYMPRGASVVDYTITSDEFLNNISHFQIGDISSFSDHCPLYLQISTNSGSSFHISRLNILSKNLLEDALEIYTKMKWS